MGEFIVTKKNARGVRDILQIDERRVRAPAHLPPPADTETPPRQRLDPELENELLALQREMEDEDGDEKHDNQEGGGVVSTPAAEPSPLRVELPDPSPAYAELVGGLYERNGPWVKQRIPRLESVAELDRLERIEREHPQFVGGRTTILDAIKARRKEIAPPAAAPQPAAAEGAAPVAEAEATRVPCTQEGCDATFGSDVGLQAHLQNIHGVPPATEL